MTVEFSLLRPHRGWPNRGAEAGLFHIHFALDAKLVNALAEGGAGDAQQFGGMHLVVAGFLERLDDQLPFHGGDDFQFRIAARPLEKLAGQGGGVGGGGLARRAGRGGEGRVEPRAGGPGDFRRLIAQ